MGLGIRARGMVEIEGGVLGWRLVRRRRVGCFWEVLGEGCRGVEGLGAGVVDGGGGGGGVDVEEEEERMRRRRRRRAAGREGGGSYCGGWGGGAGGRKVWWFGLEVAEGGNDSEVEVVVSIAGGYPVLIYGLRRGGLRCSNGQ